MKRWTLLIVFLCTFCTQNESSAPSDNETRLSDAVYFDLLQQATNHLQSGKLKEAEQTLIKAETIAPRLPMAYYMRGILYYNQKDPESAGSYFMKALFRCTQDELPGLITDLDSLTSLPLSEEENRLIRKAENSSPESAIEHLTGALSLNGMNVLSHYLIGRAYRSLDKTKKAAYHFERAVLIHPAHRKSLTALTNIYENNGRMDKYTATLEKRMRFYGTSSEIRHKLALAYIQNNKTDKAILLLERNIKDDPNYYKSCLLLGKLYANSNNRDKALEVLSVFTSGETDSESIQNDDPAFSQYRKDAKEIINRIK